MAQILPQTPSAATTPNVMRVYQLLRRLPDDEFYVWQRLPIWEGPGPDFWVLHRDQRALLLKVSEATPGDVRARLQPALFAKNRPTSAPGCSEEEALAQFLQTVVEGRRTLFGEGDQRQQGVGDAAARRQHDRLAPGGVGLDDACDALHARRVRDAGTAELVNSPGLHGRELAVSGAHRGTPAAAADGETIEGRDTRKSLFLTARLYLLAARQAN